MNTLVSIGIPIYNPYPSKSELYSFQQCYKVLSRYDKYVITFKGLDLREYQSSIQEAIECKFFNKDYFASISGYNTLLKEYVFYNTFKDYADILIYQLDAWVFKDTLMEWCKKGYDYIGAPWFSNYGSYEDGEHLWMVGNGGLSLRKIKKFLQVTNPQTHYKSICEIFETEYYGLKTLLACLSKCLGKRNTIAYYRDFYKCQYEDAYFTVILSRFKNLKMTFPTAEEAAYFSFEKSPKYLYELTNHILPFGCHAWEKYDKEFWSDKIKLDIIDRNS